MRLGIEMILSEDKSSLHSPSLACRVVIPWKRDYVRLMYIKVMYIKYTQVQTGRTRCNRAAALAHSTLRLGWRIVCVAAAQTPRTSPACRSYTAF